LLGILLYEMLSGIRPFQGKDDRTVAHSIRHDDPPSLESKAPNVPRALSQIVVTCLQKTPADRYASARELSTALEGSFATLASHPRRHLIASALARARLTDRPQASDAEKPELLGTDARRATIVPALRMLLLMLALVVAGGITIRLLLRSELETESAAGTGPLELIPQSPGSLRVLARPWGHVIVDGQQVETTPFARPIPLAAGVHHVTLKHPDAPDERRVVRIAPGEHMLLDITMQLRTKPKPSTSSPEPAPSSSTP
jgi:serine/threonine-protein kinase